MPTPEAFPNERPLRAFLAKNLPKKTTRTVATTPAVTAAPTQADYNNLKIVVDNLRAALSESGVTK